jgi:hypothetical protein
VKRLWSSIPPRARRVLAAGVVVLGVVVVGNELGGHAPRDVTLHVDLRRLGRQGFDARALRIELLDVDGSTLRRIERRAEPGGSLAVVDAPMTLPTGRWRARVEVVGDARVLSREVALEIEAGHAVEVPLPEP